MYVWEIAAKMCLHMSITTRHVGFQVLYLMYSVQRRNKFLILNRSSAENIPILFLLLNKSERDPRQEKCKNST